MTKNRKVNTLDSYATIRAVARTKPAPATQPPAPDNHAAHDEAAHDAQNLGARVARTTLPVKHQIDCYECGYKFQVHGRVTTSHCPKCRALLDLADHVIDTEWVDTIKTAGTIRLTSTGVLKNGDLIGADVVVEGIIEGGRARALRTLELGAGAIFSEKAVSGPDLRIGPGADFKFKQEAKYRNVEISGTLRARLEATGVITVKPGGLLEGEVQTEHLIVEDGGGLKAQLRIGPKIELTPESEDAA
ncbi:MAG: polymer-forming cytoskeletal protein [Verrucomicrobiia bacterium]